MKKKVIVIGAGFSGISAAAFLAKAGYSVQVLEKNNSFGGRARVFTEQGFLFDMGPSWYWMPDVFDHFFESFGKKTSDYYHLTQLDPGFTMVFGDQNELNVPSDYNDLRTLFEQTEKGAGQQLDRFMKSAQRKYEIGMQQLVYKPGLSLREFMNGETIKGIFQLQVFTNFRKYVRQHFKDPRLIQLMEFPVLFLGAMPKQTPALYSLMNYSGLKVGTYYPMGGFGKVIDGMMHVAKEFGVEFIAEAEVKKIESRNNEIFQLHTATQKYITDAVVASGDYHHMETLLDEANKKNYSDQYWNKRVFAPSSLLFYLGMDTKVNRIGHHTLFFDNDLDQHAVSIYQEPRWPEKPLFYVCCPSKTDPSVAPAGKENLFLLMPLAPGLNDNEGVREKYFQLLMTRLEKYTGQLLRDKILYKRSYCINDFKTDYYAYKGNAYGLANTLRQTAILKPKIKNKQINNLFYAGQLTVPGPGVPPSIISGEIAAGLLHHQLKP